MQNLRKIHQIQQRIFRIFRREENHSTRVVELYIWSIPRESAPKVERQSRLISSHFSGLVWSALVLDIHLFLEVHPRLRSQLSRCLDMFAADFSSFQFGQSFLFGKYFVGLVVPWQCFLWFCRFAGFVWIIYCILVRLCKSCSRFALFGAHCAFCCGFRFQFSLFDFLSRPPLLLCWLSECDLVNRGFDFGFQSLSVVCLIFDCHRILVSFRIGAYIWTFTVSSPSTLSPAFLPIRRRLVRFSSLRTLSKRVPASLDIVFQSS